MKWAKEGVFRTVGPENVMVLRVSDTDVSRDALDVTLSRPVPERGGHVLELPLSLCSRVVKGRHTGQHHVAVRNGRQRVLVQHAVNMVLFLCGGDGLGGQWARGQEIADGCGCHDVEQRFSRC